MTNGYRVKFDRFMGTRRIFRVTATTERAARLLVAMDRRPRRRLKEAHPAWLGIRKTKLFASLYDDGWDATGTYLFHPGA